MLGDIDRPVSTDPLQPNDNLCVLKTGKHQYKKVDMYIMQDDTTPVQKGGYVRNVG